MGYIYILQDGDKNILCTGSYKYNITHFLESHLHLPDIAVLRTKYTRTSNKSSCDITTLYEGDAQSFVADEIMKKLENEQKTT